MAKKVKLSDIAEIVGVSSVTVSKALNNQKGVSDAVREKIRQVAIELGYRQSPVVKTDKGYNIGVLIQENYLGNYASFYWKMYEQVTTNALQYESFALLEIVSWAMEGDLELPKLLKEQKVNGVIIIGKMADEYLELLNRAYSGPIVYLDFTYDGDKVDAVVSDSYYGACQMTKYLFSKGHKKIAYVGTMLATSSITDRGLGYVKALLENGVAPKPEWQINDRDIETGCVEDKYMELPQDMPTAFFCNCDLTAAVLIQKLKNNGYRVPEDISVVGFDNYIYPGICDVDITTYEVDRETMAKLAVKLLVKRIKGKPNLYGIHVVEGRIVEKESVKEI